MKKLRQVFITLFISLQFVLCFGGSYTMPAISQRGAFSKMDNPATQRAQQPQTQLQSINNGLNSGMMGGMSNGMMNGMTGNMMGGMSNGMMNEMTGNMMGGMNNGMNNGMMNPLLNYANPNTYSWQPNITASSLAVNPFDQNFQQFPQAFPNSTFDFGQMQTPWQHSGQEHSMPSQNYPSGFALPENRSPIPANVTVSQKQAYFLTGDCYIVKMPQNGQMQEIINLPAGRSYILMTLPTEEEIQRQQNAYPYIDQSTFQPYQPAALPVWP